MAQAQVRPQPVQERAWNARIAANRQEKSADVYQAFISVAFSACSCQTKYYVTG